MPGDPLQPPHANDDDAVSATGRVVTAFDAAWREFGPPTIRFYMRDVPPDERQSALIELIRVDMIYRAKLGERPSIARYMKQFPRVFLGGTPARSRLDALVKALNANPAGADGAPTVHEEADGGANRPPAEAEAVAAPFDPPPSPADYVTAASDADDHPFVALASAAAAVKAQPVAPVAIRRQPTRTTVVALSVAAAVGLAVGVTLLNGSGDPARSGGFDPSAVTRQPELSPSAPVTAPVSIVEPQPSEPVDLREVDLLTVIDVEADAASGVWSHGAAGIDSDVSEWSLLRIPYAPPEEYDLEVEFERLPGGSGGMSTGLIGSANGAAFEWNVWVNPQTCAFWSIDGKGWEDSPAEAKGPVTANAGGRHVSRLSVRRDGVEGYLDGVRVAGWKTDFHDLSLPEAAHWGGPVKLGLRTYANPTRFHSVKLIERSGPGRPLRK